MEKILDLADVFALGDNFNVLHVLPIIVVIGGVVAVFIFGIKKSDGGEQFKKGITITKSVNVIKQKKKRTEGGGGSPKEPKTTATDLNKSKEKKSNQQQQAVQLKKTKTSSPKAEKVAAPKKSSSTQAVGAKNQKSSQQKTKTKENNAKNANPIQNADAADGEWHTVTTKRQQKKVTTEQVVTKKEQKSSKADQLSKISLPTLPTAKGTFPKLEDVIAAMSSNSNFELSSDNKTAETTERPQRKTKSRALRE